MTEGNPNEIILIYNSDKQDDRFARSFVESIQGYSVNTIDLANELMTEEEISQLAVKMKVNIEELLNPAFDDHISVHNEGLKLISRTDLLTLMANDSKIINTPILIIGNRAYRYGSANELIDKAFTPEVNAWDS